MQLTEEPDLATRLARRVADARELGLSRARLSRLTGLTTSQLWRVERGRARTDEVGVVAEVLDRELLPEPPPDPGGLPGVDDVGTDGTWELPLPRDRARTVRGRFLAVATSREEFHRGHPREDRAPVGTSCRACRWFEVRIFLDEEHDAYVVHRAGVSAVPGERVLARADVAPSAYEVREVLSDRSNGRAVLPRVAARALAQAAAFDDDLRDAWLHRETG